MGKRRKALLISNPLTGSWLYPWIINWNTRPIQFLLFHFILTLNTVIPLNQARFQPPSHYLAPGCCNSYWSGQSQCINSPLLVDPLLNLGQCNFTHIFHVPKLLIIFLPSNLCLSIKLWNRVLNGRTTLSFCVPILPVMTYRISFSEIRLYINIILIASILILTNQLNSPGKSIIIILY